MDSMTETPSKTVSWQQHINIWKNSGLSGTKFCHANNLIITSFLTGVKSWTSLKANLSALLLYLLDLFKFHMPQQRRSPYS